MLYFPYLHSECLSLYQFDFPGFSEMSVALTADILLHILCCGACMTAWLYNITTHQPKKAIQL